MDAERVRLAEARERTNHWRKWGTYVSDRAWGTVREDYSPNGTAWDYFPFDHAHLRAFRWNDDGLFGWCDNHQRLLFSLSLWNGKDWILKERLFGLAGPQGNHGEDVKELYYYTDATPTHSYCQAVYKYPQAAFPYEELRRRNREAGRAKPEVELIDTGVFNQSKYFDVQVEYAKNAPADTVICITVTNRGPEKAPLTVLPTLWFRNTWTWGRSKTKKPVMEMVDEDTVVATESSLGSYALYFEDSAPLLFTENEGNDERLWGTPNKGYTKDAFHQYVIEGRKSAVNPAMKGTKAAALYQFVLEAGESRQIWARLVEIPGRETVPLRIDLAETMRQRRAEADSFYQAIPAAAMSADGTRVFRQALAGLLWTKQFYHFVVNDWLEGDPNTPAPPAGRKYGRNAAWRHLFNDDIISMPDKWEYPWYAAWDLAFHMIPMALVDADFAKAQLALFLREWYMHPNGQIPAYEWAFGDVNPPVHAWACWRVYQIDRRLTGKADVAFLEGCFHKLLMNFTWWVNRKDAAGNNIFEGGFLGLDNIGVFDRSAPLPTGGTIEQSDGTAWMAMFCLDMLTIALELAQVNPTYEDIASKFFEHFLYIATAMNQMDPEGLWDEVDGFYYDVLRQPNGGPLQMKIRSIVGIIPLFAVNTIESDVLDKLPNFRRRMQWFLRNRPDLCKNVASLIDRGEEERLLLSLVGPNRLRRILNRAFDSGEFLSDYGLRALSKVHEKNPYMLHVNGNSYCVAYEPAESTTGMFGGNSNWRGPVWFPVNYLFIESLQRFHYYLGDEFTVEFPKGSGDKMNLWEAAAHLSVRLSQLFLRDKSGRRPAFGKSELLQKDPHFRDLLLFHEYFHGDTGEGLGASHQTGWTALVAKLLAQSGD